ncbi:MAG: zinc ABC transporter substrate-binding protein, partial [Fibrobacterota bacterium]|nr:zinc ABC transporter substrate-binding protein [Fibrobacterota bacterium]
MASFSILGDLVKSIGREHVEVTLLVGPDADAHVYEPTPGDAKAISEAEILFMNGMGFEGWLGRLIEAAHYRKSVVVASEGILPLELGRAGHAAMIDPHAWQSLVNVRKYVANIASALA